MAQDIWTIKRCLDWTCDYLERKGDERPRLSAEWLLSAATGLSRVELYMSFDRPLAAGELEVMHKGVVRRAKGEPLQYITGSTSFRTIEVSCEPGVLIPRPETEVLVEEVLAFLDREVLGAGAPPRRKRVELPWNEEVERAREEERERAAEHRDGESAGETPAVGETPAEGGESEAEAPEEAPAAAEPREAAPAEDAPRVARVLEVGCGTGCISCSIAAERPGRAVCVATDIEPRAVALAAKNRDALGIAPETVDIRLGNLVSPLSRETEWGTFDVLVSNPPYIPTRVMAELPHEVAAFEPALALDGGEDGLDIFRRLVRAAPAMLRPQGLLACELHEDALDAAAAICAEAGFTDVRIVRDLAGRPRIILARVP